MPPGTLEYLLTELETGCPSCGAPLRIAEDDAAVDCSYCDRQLLVTRDGEVTRSYVAPRLDTDEAQSRVRAFLRAEGHRATHVGQGRWVLAPYWRYRAKAFRWYAGERTASGSGAAGGSDDDGFRDLLVRSFNFTLPASDFASGLEAIGDRDEVLVTHVADAITTRWAEIQPLSVGLEAARTIARQRTDRNTQPTVECVQGDRLTLLDEQLELIDLPFYVVDYQFRTLEHRVVLDGWSGKVTAHLDGTRHPGTTDEVAGSTSDDDGDVAAHGSAGDAPDGTDPHGTTGAIGTTAFLPARCPVCHGEMSLHRLDRVHVCASCHRAWEFEGPVAREVRHRLIDNAVDPAETGEARSARLLPFWAVRVTASGWQASVDQAGDQRLTVYIPAFDGRHIERLSQLGIHITRSRPDYGVHARWPVTPSGCTVGRADATRMAWVLLGAMASPDPGSFARFIESGAVDIEDTQLAWIPFRASGLYLREPVSGALVREVATQPWDAQDLLAA
jgi:hypothetical protein